MTGGSGELREGAVVLHQCREPGGGRVVVERYTVAAIYGRLALLSRGGERGLARVEVETLLSSPAWAVQEALW